MVQQSKREYLAAIVKRYAAAGRRYKQQILDEFCDVCGYHRKHAIRLLNRHPTRGKRKPGALKGKIRIRSDFDELPVDMASAFGMVAEKRESYGSRGRRRKR